MDINILHTIASLKRSSGGPSRTVAALCDSLGRADMDVSLLTVGDKLNVTEMVCPDPDLVSLVLTRKKKIPILNFNVATEFKSKLNSLCKDRDIKVVHDHGIWLPTNHASAAVAKALNIPLVVSPRGMLEPWALSYRSWKKKIAWQLWQKRDLLNAKAFCATAYSEAGNIRELGFHQPIAVIPNGVELPPWKEQERKKDKPFKKALFLSRIHPVKGVCELVEAWARLKPPGWRLIIAGPDEGGHARVVARVIEEAGLQDVVEIIGSVEGDAKWNLYRESDLFILPTFSENFGVVVAEALAVGTPVITTKGAPWEGLVQNKCGWWIDIGVEPLVKAIEDAIAIGADERIAMGKRGREFAEQEFGWDQIGQKMNLFYRWLLGEVDKPEFVMVD